MSPLEVNTATRSQPGRVGMVWVCTEVLVEVEGGPRLNGPVHHEDTVIVDQLPNAESDALLKKPPGGCKPAVFGHLPGSPVL